MSFIDVESLDELEDFFFSDDEDDDEEDGDFRLISTPISRAPLAESDFLLSEELEDTLGTSMLISMLGGLSSEILDELELDFGFTTTVFGVFPNLISFPIVLNPNFVFFFS